MWQMLNKLPESELLTPFMAVPRIIASSNSQLGLHLADVLRTMKDLRPAVLHLLNYLGQPLGTNAQILADIREEEWVAATEALTTPVSPDTNQTKSGNQRRREKRRNGDSNVKPGPDWVQFLVQQCFEVSLKELPLEECVIAEADGTRTYPIFYDEETDLPFTPCSADEAAREECITKYNLFTRRVADQKEVQLICHLAAKEFDALTAKITVVQGDKQYALTIVNDSGCVTIDRAKSFCAHAMVSGLPFLVRNMMLDVRFRNFPSVRGDPENTVNRVLFYFAFPILAPHTNTPMALLCVLDNKPRKSITTKQYTILKKLAEILTALWDD
ncbi:hypothetical protein BBJ29_003198 [Phytophthora kernoviae]|uniref:GAF domain-containing protein n=1 Tax=Phytophthora kernoviae TaxID=325452 RepID=A0A3R7KKA2_9STRA|nr:hypothetical protein BBJ29_003198 [Phytophthora kernoviae]